VTPAQSAGSIPAVTAAEVATLDASGIGGLANGRAWWAPAAGDIVFWAVTITQVDGQLRQAYGAAGPAPTFEAAQMLGAGALRQQVHALDADQKADRVARLQALATANPGIRPWSDDR